MTSEDIKHQLIITSPGYPQPEPSQRRHDTAPPQQVVYSWKKDCTTFKIVVSMFAVVCIFLSQFEQTVPMFCSLRCCWQCSCWLLFMLLLRLVVVLLRWISIPVGIRGLDDIVEHWFSEPSPMRFKLRYKWCHRLSTRELCEFNSENSRSYHDLLNTWCILILASCD